MRCRPRVGVATTLPDAPGLRGRNRISNAWARGGWHGLRAACPFPPRWPLTPEHACRRGAWQLRISHAGAASQRRPCGHVIASVVVVHAQCTVTTTPETPTSTSLLLLLATVLSYVTQLLYILLCLQLLHTQLHQGKYGRHPNLPILAPRY